MNGHCMLQKTTTTTKKRGTWGLSRPINSGDVLAVVRTLRCFWSFHLVSCLRCLHQLWEQLLTSCHNSEAFSVVYCIHHWDAFSWWTVLLFLLLFSSPASLILLLQVAFPRFYSFSLQSPSRCFPVHCLFLQGKNNSFLEDPFKLIQEQHFQSAVRLSWVTEMGCSCMFCHQVLNYAIQLIIKLSKEFWVPFVHRTPDLNFCLLSLERLRLDKNDTNCVVPWRKKYMFKTLND